MVSIRDAIGSRFMSADMRSAIIEMRASAAYGQLAPGRVQKPIWGKHSPGAYQEEAYRKLALIFRCIGLTASSAAKASLMVRDTNADGSIRTLYDDPIRRLIIRPNPQMRENRFLATVFMMASTASFCVIEKERDITGRVIALWPLESDRLAPVLKNQAPPDWEYRAPGIRDPFKLAAENVIVYTYQDTVDLNPRGIGPVEVAFREVGLLNVMTDFIKAFFDTGAVPQYGLILDEDKNGRMTQDKADDIKAKFGRRYGGLKRSVDPAILEGIKDIKRLSFDMNELAYQDIRNISDSAICQAFGVSPMLVDAVVGLEHSTYSNKEDARRGFYDETITNLWARLDDVLTLGLLPEFREGSPTRFLDFDTSKIRAMADDIDKRGAWAVPAASAGVITIHQFHRTMNLPLPQGDDFYIRGIAQVTTPADDPLELAANAAAAGTTTPPAPAARAIDRGRPELRALESGIAGPLELRSKHATNSRIIIHQLSNKATPWFAAYFRGAKTRILEETARAGIAAFETRGVDTINWDRERKELAPYMTRLYSGAGEMAYKSAADQTGVLGLTFDLGNPHTVKVREKLAQQVTAITDESKRVIQSTITKGLADGKNLAELADAIGAVMDGWTDTRARLVARTESMFSYGYATSAGLRESGVVDRIQMFDNPDHTDAYGASDGLTCAERDQAIDTLDSAEEHIDGEHPNGSLAITGVLIGEDA